MKEIEKSLKIILDHIIKLEKYTFWVNFEDFLDNEEKYDACCMVLQQIWEVASKIDNTKVSLKSIPIDQMRWLRNRITHDYLWIDSVIIWDTIKESIPELRTIIEKILKDIDGNKIIW